MIERSMAVMTWGRMEEVKLILLPGSLEIVLVGTSTPSLMFFLCPVLLLFAQCAPNSVFATDAGDHIIYSINSESRSIGNHFNAVFSLCPILNYHTTVSEWLAELPRKGSFKIFMKVI